MWQGTFKSPERECEKWPKRNEVLGSDTACDVTSTRRRGDGSGKCATDGENTGAGHLLP